MKPLEMTPNDMVDLLVDRIKEIIKDYDLETSFEGKQKSPQVAAGYLTKGTSDEDEPEVPWILVRYLDDQDSDEEDLATVRIIVCTYSEDEQNGWRDALSVITRIKQNLLARPLFGGPFCIKKPINTELLEEQPFPEWLATMTVRVSMPQTEQEEVIFDEWD